MEHAARAVDVHAADGDDAPRIAAKRREERARLRLGAQDRVDDDIRRIRAERRDEVRELAPMAWKVTNAGGRRRYAAEYRDGVSEALELVHDSGADERSASADDKDAHRS